MDALEVDEAGDAQSVADQVKRFIADMQAAVAERFPPVGALEDVPLSGNDLAGGALVANARVVHLSAFRLEPQSNGEERITRKRSLLRGIATD